MRINGLQCQRLMHRCTCHWSSTRTSFLSHFILCLIKFLVFFIINRRSYIYNIYLLSFAKTLLCVKKKHTNWTLAKFSSNSKLDKNCHNYNSSDLNKLQCMSAIWLCEKFHCEETECYARHYIKCILKEFDFQLKFHQWDKHFIMKFGMNLSLSTWKLKMACYGNGTHFNPLRATFFWGNIQTYIYILCHYSRLIRHRYLKSFFK